MLQKIGDSLKGKKALAYIILVPLVLVFAVWGAAGVVNLDFFGPSGFAAKVNGTPIPLEQANNAWRDQQSEWQQRFGTEIPDETRSSLQDNLLEQFVRSALLTERTRTLGYRVGEQRVDAYIRDEPAFQVEGKYNESLALARLAQLGISAAQFKADVAVRLQNGELQRALQVSEFRTPAELQRQFAVEDEQRELRYVLLSPERYQSAVPVSDADVANWFKANESRFLTPEAVRLEYAELRLEQVAAGVVVADSDLQELFAKNRDSYVEPEKRRARHILIAVENGDDAAAKKAAEAVLVRLRAGEDFAALAAQLSKDTGSAAEGGDLGWSERSAFVGPFADSVFSLKEGELSVPVKTEFGYHVIRLDGIQAGRSRSFDEVRAELEGEFRRDRAADLFGEREELIQRRLEEPGAEFGALAREYGLTVGEVPTYTRGVGGAPLGADPGLEQVIFSDATLNQRRIGGPVALGQDRFVVVKVLEHRKPRVPPLADVRDQAVAALRAERGAEAARVAAEDAVKRLEGGLSFDEAARSLGATPEPARFVGRSDPAVQEQLREVAFAMPRPKAGAPLYRALPLQGGGAAVLALLQARAAVPDGNAELRARRAVQAAARSGEGVVSAYVNELRRKADVEKNPQAFQ
jgi:peptidyl-prolyl cis-trans isomerase D